MEIVFSSKRLQQQCATEAQRKRHFPHCASQLNRRLGQMEAADSLAVMELSLAAATSSQAISRDVWRWT